LARTFAETIAWERPQVHGESQVSVPCFMPTPTESPRAS
jgi:hypothetical protein